MKAENSAMAALVTMISIGPRSGADPGERVVDRGPVRHVHRTRQYLRTTGTQTFGGSLRGVAVEVEHCDPVRLRREVVTDRQTDARRAAGDHRHAAHPTAPLITRAQLTFHSVLSTRAGRIRVAARPGPHAINAALDETHDDERDEL